MKSVKPAKAVSFDLVAGTVLAALILLSGLVVFAGSQAGLRVRAEFADEVGPFGPLVFHFSAPVDSTGLEDIFEIKPQVTGEFEWAGDRTVRFVPSQPFLEETEYELRFSPGPLGKNQESLRKEYVRKFVVRKPQIAFLSFVEQKSQIMAVGLDGGPARPLFDNKQIIFEFDISRDGEFVLFSAFNGQTGLDLWQVDRNGKNPRLILDCGPGRCSGPAISPDGKSVAYTREAPGLAPGEAPGAPRIWILDLSSGQDGSLFADSQILGYGALWSPDGKWVSSYDGLQDAIRVVSLESGEQIILDSVLGNNLSWSRDSTRMLFTDVQITSSGLRTLVNMADFRTGEIVNMIGTADSYDYGYGALAWSPAEEKFILGLRPLPDDPAQSLWLVDPEILGGPMIADEINTSYDMPRWDAWGRAVIFQQFKLKAAYRPEIALWRPDFDGPRVIAEGLSARWLP